MRLERNDAFLLVNSASSPFQLIPLCLINHFQFSEQRYMYYLWIVEYDQFKKKCGLSIDVLRLLMTYIE